jgi:hypothetical protein
MEKLYDGVLIFKTGMRDGGCLLQVYESQGKYLAVFTQYPAHALYRGPSVTNSAEYIATAVMGEHLPGVDPRQVTWIERYRPGGSEESCDVVTFAWTCDERFRHAWAAEKPVWKSIHPHVLVEMVNSGNPKEE